MIKAKKHEPAEGVMKIKRLLKEFGFSDEILKGALAKGQAEK